MNKMSILILCTGNSCRSQMVHGILQSLHTDFTVKSAGIETHGVNPQAIEVLEEIGIDISDHTSNLIDEYLNEEFDLILTVCDHASETCPVFPSTAKRIHQNFSDPSKNWSPEQGLDAFRKTRDEIKAYCETLIDEL